MSILYFEDKLGISTGYEEAWDSFLLKVGIRPDSVRRVSAWKQPWTNKMQLLTRKGNRKSPGFNPDDQVQRILYAFMVAAIKKHRPSLIIVADVALLGLVESDWNIATIDNLRGGVYTFESKADGISTQLLVTVPISAINTMKKPKDIKAMNDGFENKDEFEAAHEAKNVSDDNGDDEDDEDDSDPEVLWVEPYSVAYGRIILKFDLQKANRLLNAMRVVS